MTTYIIDKQLTKEESSHILDLIEESKQTHKWYYPDEDPEYDGGNDFFAYDSEEYSALHQYFDCEPQKIKIANPAIIYWMYVPSVGKSYFKIGKACNEKNLKLRIQECKRWNPDSFLAGLLKGTNKTETLIHKILKPMQISSEVFELNDTSYLLMDLVCEKVWLSLYWTKEL